MTESGRKRLCHSSASSSSRVGIAFTSCPAITDSTASAYLSAKLARCWQQLLRSEEDCSTRLVNGCTEQAQTRIAQVILAICGAIRIRNTRFITAYISGQWFLSASLFNLKSLIWSLILAFTLVESTKDCLNFLQDKEGKDVEIYVPVEVGDDQLFNQGINCGINFDNFDKIPVKLWVYSPLVLLLTSP